MKTTIAAAVLLVIFHQINAQCLTVDDKKPPHLTSRKNLYTGEQEFSINLLRAINQLDPEGNLFFSPYSTYHALLLAYFVSSGQTEQFLRKTLRLDTGASKTDLMNAYKLDKLQTRMRNEKKEYEFTNANRIYVDGKIEVRPCVPELFSDEFAKIDFASNPEESRLTINTWVENQTHNMIKDLLPSGAIDQTTNLVLVNAGYFKGSWKFEFNEVDTKDEIFYVSPTKRTLVKMMNLEGVLSHDVSDVLDAQIVELPYKGETVSMYILLPPFLKEDGIANTLKKLTPERFQQLSKNLTQVMGKNVKLSLPKFTLERTIEMTPILESLGVGNLFTSDADFSLLSDKDKVSVGAGIHKAKIEVNEKGTEAAAATAIFGLRMMEDDDVTVKCDHPFVFMLYNKETQTILFIGIYKKPA